MGNYKYDRLTNEFKKEPYYSNGIIDQVVWNITYKCNLDCPFCFAKKNVEEVSLDRIEDIISILDYYGVQKIDIAGGEPFIYSNLPHLLETLSKKDISATITTSGKGNENNYEFLIESKFSNLSRIIFSLDFPYSEQHDEYRGAHGVYDSQIALIRTFTKGSFYKTRINTVLSNVLLSDENMISDFINLVLELGVDEWCLIQPHYTFQEEMSKEFIVTAEDSHMFYEKIKLAMQSSKLKHLIRISENYSTYWIVEPNGSFCKPSRITSESITIPFERLKMEETNDIIMSQKKWIPGDI